MKAADRRQTNRKHQSYQSNIQNTFTPNIKKVLSTRMVKYKNQSDIQNKGVYIEGDWKNKPTDRKWDVPVWMSYDIFITGNEEESYIFRVEPLMKLILRHRTTDSNRYRENQYKTSMGVSFKPRELAMHCLWHYIDGEWQEGQLLQKIRRKK